MKSKDAVVAGTGFEGRAEVIRRHLRTGMPVHLRREPGNQHDSNAIAVLIAVPRFGGLFGQSMVQIGFVKAAAAAKLAQQMDAGARVSGVVKSFFAPSGQDHPRVSLRLEWDER